MTDIFPTKVLLATDAAAETSRAVRVAAELARKTGSELHLVNVGPSTSVEVGLSSESSRDDIEQGAEDVLGMRAKEIEAAGGTVSEVYVRQGDAAESIMRLSEEIGAGVIVVGSRGLGGLRRTFEGSVSDEIVRNSRCPVMVVREEN